MVSLRQEDVFSLYKQLMVESCLETQNEVFIWLEQGFSLTPLKTA